jgi:hypothetical protein
LDYLSLTDGSLLEADNLFAQGLVSGKCLPFLFHPNQLIVTKENGVYIALVIKDWPSTDPFFLHCWTWAPNGSGVVRQKKNCVSPRIIHDTIAISELETYPLIFAPEEVKALIKKRTQAFWNLIRSPKLVEYDGLDYQSERIHVRFLEITSMMHHTNTNYRLVLVA